MPSEMIGYPAHLCSMGRAWFDLCMSWLCVRNADQDLNLRILKLPKKASVSLSIPLTDLPIT